MSAVKRYLEDLSITVADARCYECQDMGEYFSYQECEEFVMDSLIDGDYEGIYEYLYERYDACHEVNEMPLTKKALVELLTVLKEIDFHDGNSINRDPANLLS